MPSKSTFSQKSFLPENNADESAGQKTRSTGARALSGATKLRGGYYTPSRVAAWLARWAIRSSEDCILEPSCGDGVFLAAAAAEIESRGICEAKTRAKLIAIELLAGEAEKARKQALTHATVVTGDFFEWLARQNHETMFDVVLGNPPFIRYQNFPEPSRALATQLMERQGLRPNRLTNIWVPFVVAGASLLHEGGRLAMVLPAELLQVSYAAQLRQYLADSFRRITIFACNEMFFKGAQQEVVLLTAEGKLAPPNAANRCDVALVETDSVEELLSAAPRTQRRRTDAKFVQHDTEKWLKYFLAANEIEFMRALRSHPDICDLREQAAVDVGVVTGRNEFFVVGCEQIDAYDLEEYVVPLIGRSVQLSGAILRTEEHRKLGSAGARVYLLHLAEHTDKSLPRGVQRLIGEGELHGYHRGYKCRIRNPWYVVPSVWSPDCFFFRQIYDFPRVVVNRAKATSTDTIHRMRCLGPADRIAANLYTHLTAASAEIEGRSYGGGVLELEPTEAERLLVPRRLNGAMPVSEADRLVREGRLNEVLDINDRMVLQDSIGLTSAECGLLKRIWCKMRNRRVNRSRN